MLQLLGSICRESAKEYDHFGKMITKIDTEFLEIKINANTDIAFEISKKFEYIKKPIDYFRK